MQIASARKGRGRLRLCQTKHRLTVRPTASREGIMSGDIMVTKVIGPYSVLVRKPQGKVWEAAIEPPSALEARIAELHMQSYHVLSEAREKRAKRGEPAIALQPVTLPVESRVAKSKRMARNPFSGLEKDVKSRVITKRKAPALTPFDAGKKRSVLPPRTGALHNAMVSESTINIKPKQVGR